MPTPTELYNKVVGVVKEQQEWIQTLIYETLGLRWGEKEIPADTPTTITLNQPYAAGVTDYVIWREVRTSSGQEVEVVIVSGSKSETGFQVWCSKACTMKFITTKPTINIT